MKIFERLAIACGGTGGHFYPGLSVALEFKKLGGTPLLILSGKNSEQQKEEALKYDIASEILPSPPAPIGIFDKLDYSKVSALNIMKLLKIFSTFKPNALLVMGSYTSIASGIASVIVSGFTSTISKIPMIIHEGNAIPMIIHEGNALVGKANIFLSRFASRMALSFPTVNARKILCEYEITGMPTRPDIISKRGESKEEAVSLINSIYKAGFDTKKTVILVFGGSQGA